MSWLVRVDLPDAGRAGETDRVGLAAQGIGEPPDVSGGRAALLDEREEAGQRTAIAGTGSGQQLGRDHVGARRQAP